MIASQAPHSARSVRQPQPFGGDLLQAAVPLTCPAVLDLLGDGQPASPKRLPSSHQDDFVSVPSIASATRRPPIRRLTVVVRVARLTPGTLRIRLTVAAVPAHLDTDRTLCAVGIAARSSRSGGSSFAEGIAAPPTSKGMTRSSSAVSIRGRSHAVLESVDTGVVTPTASDHGDRICRGHGLLDALDEVGSAPAHRRSPNVFPNRDAHP
jgi:hypothetical protein